MTRPWQIKVLLFGKIHVPKSVTTPGLDLDFTYDGPYWGFLLQNGKRNILVDTGISEKFIVDGKAWGGFPAEGGSKHVLKALADVGVAPEEIDTVIFTHLHNDHAGNNGLFKKAQFIFQKEEWRTLLDPLPVMQVRKDYDLSIIEELKEMNCLKIEGDFEFAEGIKVYKTPGHTPGCQSIAVQTEKGLRIMVGDHWHHYFNGFSQLTEMTDLYGKKHKITPAPKVYGPFIPTTLVYNFYDWYDSGYRLRAIAGSDNPECIVPGHETSLLVRGV
jgi:N-acyl homoserine lactone hydrolase